MSVTKNMRFNPLRQLRALIQLNYLSPLIHFFRPLNPIILYCTGAHVFPIVILLHTDTVTRMHSQEAGDVRQETRDRQEA